MRFGRAALPSFAWHGESNLEGLISGRDAPTTQETPPPHKIPGSVAEQGAWERGTGGNSRQ